jgi:HEAT repeat protein
MTAATGHLVIPRLRFEVVCCALTALFTTPLVADTFILDNGGQIEGEWLNRDEQPLTKYDVRRGGVTLTLPLTQVREAIRQTPAELEYARRVPTAADTVEGQWELAEWCKKNALAKQREVHLRRIIELNPNHQQARFALGFQFQKGEWITRSDARRQEGYEFYRGKWRTPQEIEILENRARNDLAEKEWLVRLKRWRRELDDRDKSKLAHESLAAIRDPIAARPIGEVFGRERIRAVKVLYADILAAIGNGEATKILVERALVDPDEEVFYYCVAKLAQLAPPHIGDPFVAALKDNNNAKVNRAATALAKLDDKSAISPLIDALVTTHNQVVDHGEYTSAGFGTSGTAMQKGDGLELKVYHVHNQPVLDALSKLTGADFGFNKQSWRYWHAQEKIAKEAGKPVVDARRD